MNVGFRFVCVHKHFWFFLGCLVSFVLKIFCIFCMQFSRYIVECDILHSNGDGGIRTLDPLLARQVLSQLSYTPIESGSHLLSHAVSNIVPSAA